MLATYPFKGTFPTPKEHTKGVNKKKGVILHHTGTQENTIKGVLDGLYKRDDFASCHFVVDTNGDTYMIGTPDDILWHAGVSEWEGVKDCNNSYIGIEILGPLSNGGFTDDQRRAVRKLVQHLMAAYNIPKEEIIRHKDVAPGRKTDVADTFWGTGYRTYAEYQATFIASLYVPDEEKAIQAGIFNGQEGDRAPTRKEAAIMFTRGSGKQEAEIWGGTSPNLVASTFDIITMSTRAFGKPCGAKTRTQLAVFCYNNMPKK